MSFRIVSCSLERQLLKHHIVHLEKELIFWAGIGDAEPVNLATYHANESNGPQFSTRQFLLLDHVVVIVASDTCEASHSVVGDGQVHWNFADQKRKSHLCHVSCHIGLHACPHDVVGGLFENKTWKLICRLTVDLEQMVSFLAFFLEAQSHSPVFCFIFEALRRVFQL